MYHRYIQIVHPNLHPSYYIWVTIFPISELWLREAKSEDSVLLGHFWESRLSRIALCTFGGCGHCLPLASSPFTSSDVHSLNHFCQACFNVSSPSPVPRASPVFRVWQVHAILCPVCVQICTGAEVWGDLMVSTAVLCFLWATAATALPWSQEQGISVALDCSEGHSPYHHPKRGRAAHCWALWAMCPTQKTGLCVTPSLLPELALPWTTDAIPVLHFQLSFYRHCVFKLNSGKRWNREHLE